MLRNRNPSSRSRSYSLSLSVALLWNVKYHHQAEGKTPLWAARCFLLVIVSSLWARALRHRAIERASRVETESRLSLSPTLCPGVHSARGCKLWHVLMPVVVVACHAITIAIIIIVISCASQHTYGSIFQRVAFARQNATFPPLPLSHSLSLSCCDFCLF